MSSLESFSRSRRYARSVVAAVVVVIIVVAAVPRLGIAGRAPLEGPRGRRRVPAFGESGRDAKIEVRVVPAAGAPNPQGFLMQLLGPQQAGIYAIDDPGAPGSMALTYDRHEFVTYRQEHAHVLGRGLDPSDARWPSTALTTSTTTGLVIAIHGVVEGHIH